MWSKNKSPKVHFKVPSKDCVITMHKFINFHCNEAIKTTFHYSVEKLKVFKFSDEKTENFANENSTDRKTKS